MDLKTSPNLGILSMNKSDPSILNERQLTVYTSNSILNPFRIYQIYIIITRLVLLLSITFLRSDYIMIL